MGLPTSRRLFTIFSGEAEEAERNATHPPMIGETNNAIQLFGNHNGRRAAGGPPRTATGMPIERRADQPTPGLRPPAAESFSGTLSDLLRQATEKSRGHRLKEQGAAQDDFRLRLRAVEVFQLDAMHSLWLETCCHFMALWSAAHHPVYRTLSVGRPERMTRQHMERLELDHRTVIDRHDTVATAESLDRTALQHMLRFLRRAYGALDEKKSVYLREMGVDPVHPDEPIAVMPYFVVRRDECSGEERRGSSSDEAARYVQLLGVAQARCLAEQVVSSSHDANSATAFDALWNLAVPPRGPPYDGAVAVAATEPQPTAHPPSPPPPIVAEPDNRPDADTRRKSSAFIDETDPLSPYGEVEEEEATPIADPHTTWAAIAAECLHGAEAQQRLELCSLRWQWFTTMYVTAQEQLNRCAIHTDRDRLEGITTLMSANFTPPAPTLMTLPADEHQARDFLTSDEAIERMSLVVASEDIARCRLQVRERRRLAALLDRCEMAQRLLQLVDPEGEEWAAVKANAFGDLERLYRVARGGTCTLQ